MNAPGRVPDDGRVVDVLARVRGPAGRDVSAYDADYRAVCLAKEGAP